MANGENGKRFVRLGVVADRHGAYTTKLLESLSSVQAMSARDASASLIDDYPYFFERLKDYASSRFGVDNDIAAVKAALRQASNEKHLAISSTNLSHWFNPGGKLEYYLSPEAIFKLCLAMEIDQIDAAQFVYSCLHQNWFNYRSVEEFVYCYYLALQHTFGNETFERARKAVSRAKSIIEDDAEGNLEPQESLPDATGYTRVLEQDLAKAVDQGMADAEGAAATLIDVITAKRFMFTGVKRTAIRQYNIFFEGGAIGIKPLKDLYKEREGLELPVSYLDPEDNRTIDSIEKNPDRKRKRLLWGAEFRSDWLKRWDKDYDILHTKEIKIRRHDVEGMQSNGVLRGNMIALLFFHYCFENIEAFQSGASRGGLFERFYNTTNQILDDCGMMPLHPRKMLDSLFLKSIAHSTKDPIDYLNDALRSFYLE